MVLGENVAAGVACCLAGWKRVDETVCVCVSEFEESAEGGGTALESRPLEQNSRKGTLGADSV